MVAYGYQPEFVEPTWSGRKVHTIRAIGLRRHAREGEDLQHYTGMRTKNCRLFARSRCLMTRPISIEFLGSGHDDQLEDIVTIGAEQICTRPFLDKFAESDGFPSWSGLRMFWGKHHRGVRQFTGLIIYWKDMVPVR